MGKQTCYQYKIRPTEKRDLSIMKCIFHCWYVLGECCMPYWSSALVSGQRELLEVILVAKIYMNWVAWILGNI